MSSNAIIRPTTRQFWGHQLGDFLAWFGRNTGAIQAFAALALVAITAAYVWLTYRLNKAATAQALAAEKLLTSSDAQVRATERLLSTAEAQATAAAKLLATSEEQVRILKLDQYRQLVAPRWPLVFHAKRLTRLYHADSLSVSGAMSLLPTEVDLAEVRRVAAAFNSRPVVDRAEECCDAVRSAREYLNSLERVGSPMNATHWQVKREALYSAADKLVDACAVELANIAFRIFTAEELQHLYE